MSCPFIQRSTGQQGIEGLYQRMNLLDSTDRKQPEIKIKQDQIPPRCLHLSRTQFLKLWTMTPYGGVAELSLGVMRNLATGKYF